MLRLFALLAAILLAAPDSARAEPRVALVVGNALYGGGSVRPLPNPANDARLIANRLRTAGFGVTLVLDADLAASKRAVAEFGGTLRNAGAEATGLLFYAGHAVQSFDANDLLPVDVAVTDAADLDLAALEATSILRQMNSAKNRTNIFILDACRSNPFEAIRGIDDNGLAEMRAPAGTFLAFATAPGEVAYDRAGAQSPFSQALAAEMLNPGESVEGVFRKVRIAVRDVTGGRQTPWDTSLLTREVAFVPARVAHGEDLEARLWNNVNAARDPAQVRLFIDAFPEGRYGPAARDLLGVLSATAAGPATAAQLAEAPRALPAPPPQRHAQLVLSRPDAGQPSEDERAALESARRAGTVAGYEDYLARFPSGTFTELARIELGALAAAAAAAAPVATPAVPEAGSPVAEPATAPAVDPAAPITFDTPLAQGEPGVVGRSLAELIAGSPLVSPIEGLPDEVWRGKRCSDCHQWQRDNLCAQAQTYIPPDRAAMLLKPHPYGVSFKSILKTWAENGCP